MTKINKIFSINTNIEFPLEIALYSTFKVKNDIVKCIKGDDCSECYFGNKTEICSINRILPCRYDCRTDNHDVIFKKV